MAYLPCGRPCGKQASPWRCNIISAAFRILNDLRVSLHGGHFLKKENNCHSEQCSGEESREQKSLCKYTGSFTLFRMKAYFCSGTRAGVPDGPYVGSGRKPKEAGDPCGRPGWTWLETGKKQVMLKPGKKAEDFYAASQRNRCCCIQACAKNQIKARRSGFELERRSDRMNEQ